MEKNKQKSVRHWLITELGHNGTENIHLHGIIWTNKNIEAIGEQLEALKKDVITRRIIAEVS